MKVAKITSKHIKSLNDLSTPRSLEEELEANRNTCPMAQTHKNQIEREINEAHNTQINHLINHAYAQRDMQNFNEITSFRSPLTSTNTGNFQNS
jgi:hypothetical protein